jgi:hypothetical protein
VASIEGVGRLGVSRLGARGTVRTSAGFAVPGDLAVASHAAGEAAPTAALGSMLTLQELGGEAAEDREARRHGQDLLAALAGLQRALLTSGDDTAALQRLAELAAVVPRAADRRLAAMVSAIIVRVRVELARRQL